MTREGLIKKVALKMDEISSSDDSIVSVVGPEDNNPLYVQISCLLNESVNEVLMKAPIYRLHSQAATKDSKPSIDGVTSLTVGMEYIFGGARRAASITLPDDFLRLVSISSDCTQRPIVDIAIEGDNTDKRQHNKHLVAKTEKPVAVLHTRGESRAIKCYSFEKDITPLLSMTYIKRYDNGTDTMADACLDDYLIDIVSWVCAGKVFVSRGDSERGKVCDENALALMT